MKIINSLLSSKWIIRYNLVLIIASNVMKLCGVDYISDVYALGMMGFTAGLIALYNNKRRDSNDKLEDVFHKGLLDKEGN